MSKHLNATNFQSGIHHLLSSEAIHDTGYKHVSMIIEKRNPVEGGETLNLSWQVAYVAKSKVKEPNFSKLLQIKPDTKLTRCINCDSSQIFVAQMDQAHKLLYSAADSKTSQIPIADIWDGQVVEESIVTPQKAWLTTERYCSDL